MVVAGQGSTGIRTQKTQKEKYERHENGDVLVVQGDQPLDLKEIIFTPRPIAVSFLRPLS